MVTTLKIGLVNIPIMLVNFANNRYSVSGLHQFSNCCNERIGNKKYCKECGKDVLTSNIRKGLDKDTILTNEQSDNLKELLDNGTMEVIAIQNFNGKILFEIIPFIQKAQLILPSISKNYKKPDVRTYYSFINALKENNKMCLVKFVNRGLEHIGMLLFKQEDLMFIELPFKNYNNISEINRLKEAVENVIRVDKIENLEVHKGQATTFIKQFKNKENKIELIKEEKQILLKKMVEDIRIGVVTTTKEIKEVVNPFGV